MNKQETSKLKQKEFEPKEPITNFYRSADGSYLILNVNNKGRPYPISVYHSAENWCRDIMQQENRFPSFKEFQQMNARRALACWYHGEGATYPDTSMRAIYSRLRNHPDPVIQKCWGPKGWCIPIKLFFEQRPPYLTLDRYEQLKNDIRHVIAEAREEKRKRRQNGY